MSPRRNNHKSNKSKGTNATRRNGASFAHSSDHEKVADIVNWDSIPNEAFERPIVHAETPRAYVPPKPPLNLSKQEEEIYMKLMKKTNEWKVRKANFKANFKANVRRALVTARPYAIGAGVGAAIVAAGAALWLAKFNKNMGTLVKLEGPAAALHSSNNQMSMTPEQVQFKIRLLFNPGTVLISKAKDKRYSLLGGELTEVEGDFAKKSKAEISKGYAESWEDVLVPVKVFLTKLAKNFESRPAAA